MSDHEFFYFPESDCDPDEIRAAVDDGRAEAWRRDGEGRQWFRRRIHPARIFGVESDSGGLLARTLNRLANWMRR